MTTSSKKAIAWIETYVEIYNPSNSAEILSPYEKAAREGGFKNSIFYKMYLYISLRQIHFLVLKRRVLVLYSV